MKRIATTMALAVMLTAGASRAGAAEAAAAPLAGTIREVADDPDGRRLFAPALVRGGIDPDALAGRRDARQAAFLGDGAAVHVESSPATPCDAGANDVDAGWEAAACPAIATFRHPGGTVSVTAVTGCIAPADLPADVPFESRASFDPASGTITLSATLDGRRDPRCDAVVAMAPAQ